MDAVHQTTVNLNGNPDFTVAFATADTMVASDYVGIVSGPRTTGDGYYETAFLGPEGIQLEITV